MEEAGINLNKRPNHLLYIIKRQTGVYQLVLVDLLLNNLTEKHFRLFNFINKFSKTAAAKIEAAGGKAEVI